MYSYGFSQSIPDKHGFQGNAKTMVSNQVGELCNECNDDYEWLWWCKVACCIQLSSHDSCPLLLAFLQNTHVETMMEYKSLTPWKSSKAGQFCQVQLYWRRSFLSRRGKVTWKWQSPGLTASWLIIVNVLLFIAILAVRKNVFLCCIWFVTVLLFTSVYSYRLN